MRLFISVGSVPSICGSFELFNPVSLSVVSSCRLADRQDVQGHHGVSFCFGSLSNFAVVSDHSIWCGTGLLEMKIQVSGIGVVLSGIGWLFGSCWFLIHFCREKHTFFWYLLSVLNLGCPLLLTRSCRSWFWFITVYSHVKGIFELEHSSLIGKKVLPGIGWVRSRETHPLVPPIWAFVCLPSLLWVFGHTQTPYRKSFPPAGVGLTA